MDVGKIRFNVLEFTTRVDDTIFDNYDRSRRGVEFGYLIDVYRYKYGIVKDVLGSFRVPVFNKDNEELFSIQIQVNGRSFRVAILFPNAEMLSAYHKKHGRYSKPVFSMKEVETWFFRFINNMSDLLDNADLYFMEVTETENELLYYETEKTFETLRRGAM